MPATGRNLHLTDHWVLSRNIRNCKVCGTELVKRGGQETPWERRTTWCEACQSPDNRHVDLQRAATLLARHPCRKIVDIENGNLIAPVDEAVQSESLRSNEGGMKQSR